MKRKELTLKSVLLVFVLLIPMLIISQEIEIQVSPHVLNLQSNGVVVTIHTDIAYSAVDGSSVSLNGIDIESWKADDQGNFVAKFDMDEVKGLEDLEIGGYNTLTLDGITLGGTSFTGSEEILVLDNLPKGKN